MLRLLLLAAVFQSALSQQYQQRTVPGVPPQTYEQNYQPPPPPPMQQQQQQQQPPSQGQQQYQQPPQQQQYQQPPQQQQQQFQQQQQQQQQFQAHPSHGDPQLLNPTNINQEREHIQEHMDVPIDTSKMSEQELMFHYFKMHDADNNNKLDGCELIKSLIHWHGQMDENHKAYTDAQLENVMEHALKHTDMNWDGYIDFIEYRLSSFRAKAAVNKNADGKEMEFKATYKDDDLAQVVEGALKQADGNNDGYISYEEFRQTTGEQRSQPPKDI